MSHAAPSDFAQNIASGLAVVPTSLLDAMVESTKAVSLDSSIFQTHDVRNDDGIGLVLGYWHTPMPS